MGAYEPYDSGRPHFCIVVSPSLLSGLIEFLSDWITLDAVQGIYCSEKSGTLGAPTYSTAFPQEVAETTPIIFETDDVWTEAINDEVPLSTEGYLMVAYFFMQGSLSNKMKCKAENFEKKNISHV